MTERQRNMIEQERITAKQIKERNMAEQIREVFLNNKYKFYKRNLTTRNLKMYN